MKIGNLKWIKIYRFKSYQALLLAVGIVFGLLIVAQWQSLPTRVTNPVAPYLGLKETRDSLQTEQTDLKSEITNDQNKVADLQKNLKSLNQNKDKIDLLETQKSMSGLTKLQGPGIYITLDDSKQSLITEQSIVHAADLRDVVNLLWNTGAEAISINGERIVYNSSIDCIVNTILVNNSRLSNPFNITAIGNQKLMLAQIQNHLNLADLYQRRQSNGLIFTFSSNNNLLVDAFSGSFDLKSGGS